MSGALPGERDKITRIWRSPWETPGSPRLLSAQPWGFTSALTWSWRDSVGASGTAVPWPLGPDPGGADASAVTLQGLRKRRQDGPAPGRAGAGHPGEGGSSRTPGPPPQERSGRALGGTDAAPALWLVLGASPPLCCRCGLSRWARGLTSTRPPGCRSSSSLSSSAERLTVTLLI